MDAINLLINTLHESELTKALNLHVSALLTRIGTCRTRDMINLRVNLRTPRSHRSKLNLPNAINLLNQ